MRPYFPQIVLLAGPIFCLCVCLCLCVPERRPKFGSKTKRGKRLREIVDLGGLPWGGGFQHSGSYPIVVFQHSEVAHKRQKAGHAFRLPSRSRRLPQRSEHLTNLRGWRTNLRPPRLINQSPKTKRCSTARTTATTRSCLAQGPCFGAARAKGTRRPPPSPVGPSRDALGCARYFLTRARLRLLHGPPLPH